MGGVTFGDEFAMPGTTVTSSRHRDGLSCPMWRGCFSVQDCLSRRVCFSYACESRVNRQIDFGDGIILPIEGNSALSRWNIVFRSVLIKITTVLLFYDVFCFFYSKPFK